MLNIGSELVNSLIMLAFSSSSEKSRSRSRSTAFVALGANAWGTVLALKPRERSRPMGREDKAPAREGSPPGWYRGFETSIPRPSSHVRCHSGPVPLLSL